MQNSCISSNSIIIYYYLLQSTKNYNLSNMHPQIVIKLNNQIMSYQRSAEKINQKDIRNKPLPTISPEPSLEPDACPLSSIPLDPSNPLDPRPILTKIKSSHQNKPSKAIKSIIIPNKSQTQDHLSLMMRIVLITAELERMHQQQQYHKIQHSDSLVWKQKYQDILRRYKEGQASFYKLAEKSKQLEAQLKNINQIPQSTLFVKDAEIRSLKQQLKTSRDASQNNMLESSNKRLQNERSQLRHLLDTADIQKSKLQHQNSQIKQCIRNYQNQMYRVSQQVSFLKQQMTRTDDQKSKLLQTIGSLKQQLSQKDMFYENKFSAQVSQYKQNADIYLSEYKRLSNQNSRLNEKIALESNNQRNRVDLEARLKNQIQFFKTQVQKFQRLKLQATSLRSQLSSSKNKNNDLQIQINQLFAKNRQSTLKIYELESNIRKLQQEKLYNSETLINYQFIKKQKQQQNKMNQIQKSHLLNKISELEKQISLLQVQQRDKGIQIQNIIFQNSRLKGELSQGNDIDLLKKHLQLSGEEMDRIYRYTKAVVIELTGRVSWLSKEKQQLLKKNQYQQFQLQKLYQVLKTRKQQLQNCYRTIQTLRKGTEEQVQGQDLTQMLRNRRQQLL